MGCPWSSRRKPSAQQADSTAGDTGDGLHQLSTATETTGSHNEVSLNICERCKGIDFNYIFNIFELKTFAPKSVLYLGELEENALCELCQFFYLMRWRPENNGRQIEMKDYHLRLYLLGAKDATSAAYPSKAYASSRVLCVMRGKPNPTWHYPDPTTELHWIVPQSVTMGPLFDNEPPKLTALPFNRTSIDYSLLQAWCKRCDLHHSTCASAKKTEAGGKQWVRPPIRCIDCHVREIVEVETSDRFFALSYVWGKRPAHPNVCTRSARETTSKNSVWLLPSGIPSVIEDAMTVVTSLGERYLWVDQYCIDQNNADDKHIQIQNMASIYEGAYATIVAFSAADSAAGLPGVKDLPRKPYHSAPGQMMHPVSAIRPSITTSADLVTSSVWMTRGWTYQEAILSRRLLVFTDYQVEFICSNSAWHECTSPGIQDMNLGSGRPSEDGNLFKAITPVERSSLSGDIQADMDELVGYIEEYSGRQLSYQTDALNAITGLLSRISTFTYLGIPICAPDYLITPQNEENGEGANALLQFLASLTWYPAQGCLLRRYAFPSWSWLEWQGGVKFPKILRRPYNPRARASVWISKQVTDSKDATLAPFAYLLQMPSSGTKHTGVLPHLNKFIWVEGPVIKMKFAPGYSTHKGYDEEVFVIRHSDPPLDIQYLSGPGDPGSGTRISFRTCNIGSKKDAVYQRVITEEWMCLLLIDRPLFVGLASTGYFLILDQDRRDKDTEAEGHHCVVGSGKVRIHIDDDSRPWDDPSLRRKIKLG